MKPLPIEVPCGRPPGACGLPGSGMPGPKKRRKISGMSSGIASSSCAWLRDVRAPPPMSATTLTTPGPTWATSWVKSGSATSAGAGALAVVDCCADATGSTTAVVAVAVRAIRIAACNGAFMDDATSKSDVWIQFARDGTGSSRARHRQTIICVRDRPCRSGHRRDGLSRQRRSRLQRSHGTRHYGRCDVRDQRGPVLRSASAPAS